MGLLLWTGCGGIIAAQAAELFVAPGGNDANPGTQAAPLRTIQRAADLAQPGDVITVHEGVYRERISPPRGGESDAKRIVYQAAPGEKVEIKGSEVVKNWVKVQDDVWKVTLPNSFFGSFNPYSDLIHGDWFNPKGREHHTGAVYLNGEWLTEAAKLDDVLKPAADHAALVRPGGQGEHHDLGAVQGRRPQRATGGDQRPPDGVLSGKDGHQLHHRPRLHHAARGHPVGPAHRRADRPDRHALEQGLDHREQRDQPLDLFGHRAGKIRRPVGQQVGQHRRGLRQDHRAGPDRTAGPRRTSATTSSATTPSPTASRRASSAAWAPSFSMVTGNTIHDIHVRRLFAGAEMAGIKFHAAIDVEISRNHIYRTCRGLWLDWMAQGTRVSGNLFHDNQSEDLFVEVDHGPFLVDNNIFLSPDDAARSFARRRLCPQPDRRAACS